MTDVLSLSEWVNNALTQRLLDLIIVMAVTVWSTRTMQNGVKDHRECKHAEQSCIHVAGILMTLNATILTQKL